MASDMMKIVQYDTALGNVQLDAETVKQYLVKGNGAVTDQEVFLFIKMCEAQKLNPFVTGEAYLIKFGSQPAQMVVGYDTYKRRAEENPNHLYTESGIVVSRGSNGEIVQKQGACLYPSEKLIGGWCRVHRMRNNVEVTTYKEVGIDEYDKKQSIWKDKPCMMIEKVAISQCLREAYPKDYEGLYSETEMGQSDVPSMIPANAEPAPVKEETVTQEERKAMFSKAHNAFGDKDGNDVIMALLNEEGLKSTTGMTKTSYERINRKLDEMILAKAEEETPEN